MIMSYARASTDDRSVGAQVRPLYARQRMARAPSLTAVRSSGEPTLTSHQRRKLVKRVNADRKHSAISRAPIT